MGKKNEPLPDLSKRFMRGQKRRKMERSPRNEPLAAILRGEKLQHSASFVRPKRRKRRNAKTWKGIRKGKGGDLIGQGRRCANASLILLPQRKEGRTKKKMTDNRREVMAPGVGGGEPVKKTNLCEGNRS